MNRTVMFLLIGVVFAILEATKAQEVSIYAGGQQPGNQGNQEGPENPEGNDELQDEGELASALGIDRQALYEDLMRIQEELGGSPLAALAGGGDSEGDQPSQEDY